MMPFQGQSMLGAPTMGGGPQQMGGGGQGNGQILQMLQQAGIPMHVLQMWGQKAASMPPQAQAQFIQQQLMGIPGLQQKLQQFQQPQNQNVTTQQTPGPIVPGGMPNNMQPSAGQMAPTGSMSDGQFRPPASLPPAMIGPPATGAAPPILPGVEATPRPIGPPASGTAPGPTGGGKQSKGRAKHGKGMAPGQAKKMNIPGSQAAPQPAPRPMPMPIAGAQSGGMMSGGGLQNDYRRRMIGQGRGISV